MIRLKCVLKCVLKISSETLIRDHLFMALKIIDYTNSKL